MGENNITHFKFQNFINAKGAPNASGLNNLTNAYEAAAAANMANNDMLPINARANGANASINELNDAAANVFYDNDLSAEHIRGCFSGADGKLNMEISFGSNKALDVALELLWADFNV